MLEIAKQKSDEISPLKKDHISGLFFTKQLRLPIYKRNLTQYRLSQLSGIPFPTIKSIMQKRTKGISLKTIIMLSDGLGIKPSEFIDDVSFLSENLKLD